MPTETRKQHSLLKDKYMASTSGTSSATDDDSLQKLELDSLLPEVKGRVLEHLDHENIFKLKSLSKNWKALIESKEFIQALALKDKPVLTTCSFFIHKGVWQWAAFDPNSNSISGHKGKWRKLPPLTFLPPTSDPDPDLFKQFLFCANEGLVCMNFSKPTIKEWLIVFNPLTQQWKELLPLLHRRNPVLMHLYVDQSSKSCHILAAGSSASGEESLSRITEVYHSRTGQWERVGDFPGPSFLLNEYQSGVFQNGNIFCIGFVELGDQIVKGILGYNVEGVWSTKWTDRGLPNSSTLQLVENSGDLFLFSERDNGPVVEHWVDRIEWTPSEGDNESTTFTLVNVLKKDKSGGRSLEVYPEFALMPFSASQLCICSTMDRTVILNGAPSLERFLPRLNLGQSVSNIFRSIGFSTLLSVAGASPASAAGASSSQTSTTFPTVWQYLGVGAGIAAAVIGAIGVGVAIYMCYYGRERGDSMRGALHELTRPFRDGARDLRMSVSGLTVGKAKLGVSGSEHLPGHLPDHLASHLPSHLQSSPGHFQSEGSLLIGVSQGRIVAALLVRRSISSALQVQFACVHLT